MQDNRCYSKTHTLLFILLSIAVAALASFGTFSRRPAVVSSPGATASSIEVGNRVARNR